MQGLKPLSKMLASLFHLITNEVTNYRMQPISNLLSLKRAIEILQINSKHLKKKKLYIFYKDQ